MSGAQELAAIYFVTILGTIVILILGVSFFAYLSGRDERRVQAYERDQQRRQAAGGDAQDVALLAGNRPQAQGGAAGEVHQGPASPFNKIRPGQS